MKRTAQSFINTEAIETNPSRSSSTCSLNSLNNDNEIETITTINQNSNNRNQHTTNNTIGNNILHQSNIDDSSNLYDANLLPI